MPRRWLAAAWLFLVITLASGTLLRWLWTGAAPVTLNARYLLHAHSHVALLGWTFVGFFALVFAGAGAGADRGAGTGSRGRTDARDGVSLPRLAAEVAFVVLVLAIFWAFLQEGYAFWSILLSMLHIAVSVGLIAIYLTRFRSRMDARARPWVNQSLLWFAVATVAPLMLSGGAALGDAWIDAWVGFYLVVLFNGWLTMGVLGLLVVGVGLRPGRGAMELMALGVLPAALPRFLAWIEIPAGLWIGWVGGLLFGGGLALAGIRTLSHATAAAPAQATALEPESPWTSAGGSPGTLDRLILGSAGAAMLLVGSFWAIGSAPWITESVFAVRSLVVGFVHLQLLGLVSAGLVLLLFRPPSPLPAGWVGHTLLLLGSWTMVAVLLATGILEWAGRPVFWRTQWILTWTGAVATLGALCLLLPPFARAGRIRSSSG